MAKKVDLTIRAVLFLPESNVLSGDRVEGIIDFLGECGWSLRLGWDTIYNNYFCLIAARVLKITRGLIGKNALNFQISSNIFAVFIPIIKLNLVTTFSYSTILSCLKHG